MSDLGIDDNTRQFLNLLPIEERYQIIHETMILKYREDRGKDREIEYINSDQAKFIDGFY